MYKTESFVTCKMFYADEHFPYGISRSGEFNREQANLLEHYGEAYQALHSGQRSPINEEERDFVAGCKGEKEARTEHELAWTRFCDKTKKRRTCIPAFYEKIEIDDDDFTSLGDELLEDPIE